MSQNDPTLSVLALSVYLDCSIEKAREELIAIGTQKMSQNVPILGLFGTFSPFVVLLKGGGRDILEGSGPFWDTFEANGGWEEVDLGGGEIIQFELPTLPKCPKNATKTPPKPILSAIIDPLGLQKALFDTIITQNDALNSISLPSIIPTSAKPNFIKNRIFGFGVRKNGNKYAPIPHLEADSLSVPPFEGPFDLFGIEKERKTAIFGPKTAQFDLLGDFIGESLKHNPLPPHPHSPTKSKNPISVSKSVFEKNNFVVAVLPKRALGGKLEGGLDPVEAFIASQTPQRAQYYQKMSQTMSQMDHDWAQLGQMYTPDLSTAQSGAIRGSSEAILSAQKLNESTILSWRVHPIPFASLGWFKSKIDIGGVEEEDYIKYLKNVDDLVTSGVGVGETVGGGGTEEGVPPPMVPKMSQNAPFGASQSPKMSQKMDLGHSTRPKNVSKSKSKAKRGGMASALRPIDPSMELLFGDESPTVAPDVPKCPKLESNLGHFGGPKTPLGQFLGHDSTNLGHSEPREPSESTAGNVHNSTTASTSPNKTISTTASNVMINKDALSMSFDFGGPTAPPITPTVRSTTTASAPKAKASGKQRTLMDMFRKK